MSSNRPPADAPPSAVDSALQRLVGRLCSTGEASAALGLVATPDRIIEWAAAGSYDQADRRTPDLDARFDLASLTKPIVATLALVLDQQGLLPLTTRVGGIWPRTSSPLQRRMLGTLLRHRAGLVPWTPLVLRCRERRQVASHILTAADLHRSVPGTYSDRTYSDLGPILWGLAAEQALGVDLATLIQRHVATPLGLGQLEGSPGSRDDVVACKLNNSVERRLAAAQGHTLPPVRRPARGQVQDGNARFLGGLAGHAGLFCSARDLWRFASAWLVVRPPLASASLVKALAGGGPYALGWARRRLHGSAGAALSPSSFGHTGFVGNSLWLDPRPRRIAILLSHRRHNHGDFNRIRRGFHRLAAAVNA